MTSKQVKKAYQQANRGPRISRAEQRRRDAEELERQKKEYEREKAAAKAKAAREKKAVKENAEKEARRKMGVPEPSRFVGASQPTISKFVRNGNTGKRSWQEMKMDTLVEDSDATLSDTGFEGKDDAQPPTKRVTTEDDSEDEFGEFPSLSQSDLLEKIDSSMASMRGSGSGAGSPAVVVKRAAEPPYREVSQELPARKSSKGKYPLDDSQDFAAMATTQLLSEAAEAAQRSDGAAPTELPILKQPSPKPLPPDKAELLGMPASKNIVSKSVPTKKPNQPVSRPSVSNRNHSRPAMPVVVSRPALQEASANMPPPPVPLKEKNAISFAPSPLKPKLLLQNNAKTDNISRYNILPSATQVFLENYVDDFFPSPTQEMRELISVADELPSNTQIARELSPERPAEIISHLPHYKPLTRASTLRPIAEENSFDDLICTQDLILSSQELLEITTPSRAKSDIVLETEKEKPVPKSKARFFEEKEDDILHAVLHDSKTAAARPRVLAPQARERKRPFFEEKEDDLLAAAIHESRVMAEKQEAVKVPLKEANRIERKARTLKRGISSASTDYGEDEFSGGEWESLGL
jgi:hypothetical protein